MELNTIVNTEAKEVLTPVNEFISIIRSRYNSSPNSLAAGGYREVLKMAEQFVNAEIAFSSAAYTAGYEQAIQDIRDAKNIEPQNESKTDTND